MTDRARIAPEEHAVSALGRLMRESGERHSAFSADAELERLLRTVAGAAPERKPRHAPRPWALVAAAVVVLGLTGSFEWSNHARAALTFSANGVRREGPVAIAADGGRVVH